MARLQVIRLKACSTNGHSRPSEISDRGLTSREQPPGAKFLQNRRESFPPAFLRLQVLTVDRQPDPCRDRSLLAAPQSKMASKRLLRRIFHAFGRFELVREFLDRTDNRYSRFPRLGSKSGVHHPRFASC